MTEPRQTSDISRYPDTKGASPGSAAELAPQGMLRRAWVLLIERGPSQLQFWVIALFVGVAAGLAAVGFRVGIGKVAALVYGAQNPRALSSHAADLPWIWLVMIPACGGLVVGVLLDRFTTAGKVRAVADVIEAAALHDGRLRPRRGIVSTLASFITLSTGGSSGREGPVVHLAALIATSVNKLIRADGVTGRDLLGCAVAAAVSASFNAPIAGTLFALEVVLRHYAVHAFAPTAIASVAGTVVSRMLLGDTPEFPLTNINMLAFYVELPAFLLLGVVCGLVACFFMWVLIAADRVGDRFMARTGLPRYLRPAIAGALVGVIAIRFPHVISVGYETTSQALMGQLLWTQAALFVLVKIIAVAITLGGNMGGGVFSPSLMIGALSGLVFGIIATSLVPEYSGEGPLYALAGMGAVAAAVLGAPISTILIVFELTGDWQTGLAVMVTVSTSVALASRFVDRSFFLTQLAQRGVALAEGPQKYLLATLPVETLMRAAEHPRAAPEEECWNLIEDGAYLDRGATLQQAMPLFERLNASFLPVVVLGGADEPPELWGALFQIDALRAYNRALASTAAEEHS